jgi:hypothetical protein
MEDVQKVKMFHDNFYVVGIGEINVEKNCIAWGFLSLMTLGSKILI